MSINPHSSVCCVKLPAASPVATLCVRRSIHIQEEGMHPNSSTTTPFSVKDILKLEQQHDFENEFLMTDQVAPMHLQHTVCGAFRGFYDCQAEPCVSGGQEKLAAQNSAVEEINEQGEKIQTLEIQPVPPYSQLC